MKDLQTLRKAIDAADRQLLNAFCQRMTLCGEIAAYKKSHDLPVLDLQQQAQKLSSVAALVPEALCPYVQSLYEEILRSSRIYQQRLLEPPLGDGENLVLIGMPGCGKTTVGRALAALSDRPFLDSDEHLAQQTGQSVAQLIAQEGESGFRVRESQVLAQWSNLSGYVIATGGGCVLCPENEAFLRKNGRLIWLLRPLAELSRVGRPLSEAADLTQLYRQRQVFYTQFADFSVSNSDRSPEQSAREILDSLAWPPEKNK